jgi:hypothetical protein
MADTNEVFRNLEDATGEGIAHVGKAPGGAQSTDEQAPVLPAVDGSGNLQNINVRDEGDAAANVDALPALIAKDSSGDLAYLTLDASGKLPVSQDDPGTVLQDLGGSATGIVGLAVNVAQINLTVNEEYICSLGVASATKAVKWTLEHLDDATVNILETKISGPGDFNVKFELKSEFTAGASGTQQLRIRGEQLRGPATDLYASAKILQKA